MAISAASDLSEPGHRFLEILRTEGPVTIHLSGELDLGSAQMLSDALAGLEAEQATPVVVDLSGVTFMDCSGLAVLLGAYNRASRDGRELVLTNPRRAVRRIFHLTGCRYLLSEALTA